MPLSRAAGAKRNDVLASLDPLTSGQFQYLHLVELRDGGEVETIKAFGDREFGGLDPTFDLAAIPFDHLPFGKPEQVSDVIDAFGGRSEEHTSELQSLMRISYAVFCLKNK